MKQIFYTLMLVSALALVGCGSDDKNGGNQSPAPAPTGTPAPQPGNQCSFHPLTAGDVVFYSGPKGSGSAPFSDENKSYLGTVLQIVPDGSGSFDVKVRFDDIAVDQWVKINVLAPQGICTPPIAGVNIRYTGAANANFPPSFAPYLGKAVAAYANGFIEVDWDHLADNTVEPIQNLLFYQ